MQKFNLSFIKNRRIELKKSMQQMADRLGFKNASTYLKYERGEYEFKANQLPLLANELECNIKDFFDVNVAKSATVKTA